MNHITLIGRLTADPEIRVTQSNKKVASYTLAVDRGYGENKATDFIRCTAWEGRADFAEKYLHKGMKIAIEGSLRVDTFQKDGQNRSNIHVIVANSEFCESRQENVPSAPKNANTGTLEGFMSIPDEIEDGLPFH